MRRVDAPRYSPGREPCRIDLSDNTNAWGMPPAARRAITGVNLSARYPSAYADDFKAAVAAYTGVTEDMIVTGCGSDDVLDAAIRALGSPGDRLAYPAPSFVMIPTFASLNGLSSEATAFADLATCNAQLIYLCSPNNPTGALVPRDRIETLLGRMSVEQVLIVDEAYAEFAGTTVVDLVHTYDRLVVTRTMSKAFGLASLRVGYALGSPQLVSSIERSRGPYKVTALSERAAVASLTEGRDWMTEHVALAVYERDRLARELRARGLEPLESAANFLFVPMPDAIAVGAAMLGRGVRVRAFTEPSGLRITVAPWPVMQDALEALDEARGCA